MRLLGMAAHRPEAEGADEGARVWDIMLDNGGRLALSEFEARAFQLITLEGLKKRPGAANPRRARAARSHGKVKGGER
jgi:hypothetical protein